MYVQSGHKEVAMSNSVPWDDLDVGVRGVVRLLNENGFTTCDSGDGKSKFGEDGKPLPEWRSEDPDFEWVMDIPHVAIRVEAAKLASECDRLLTLLVETGVSLEQQGPTGTEPSIQGSYDPVYRDKNDPAGGVAFILLTNVDDSKLPHPGR
jgi:hypothetical protein